MVSAGILHPLGTTCLPHCFSRSIRPISKANSSSDAMSLQASAGEPAAGKQPLWSLGEAGPALGPQPNICHDTQIIFVCGWQVLWLRWFLKCVVKVSIIPCSRHCGALEEQPSLQASPLLLAWIAHRLLQSCKKQQREAARYLPSRYVSS